MKLDNDSKIAFCNTMEAMKAHQIGCKDCDLYLRWGDGDLCDKGKEVIAMNLAYINSNPETL